mmetsp:Transcript_49753/g.144367  ORF Transcript_49753/g.144367 Transcript_49753/m.144367 type:complete len:250 (-) Transcript_49753:38-787(-)
MAAVDLASLARQATSLERDRTEALRRAEARVRGAEAKAEAAERAAQDLKLRQQEELAALRAKEEREAAAVRARAERKLRELESQCQATARRRREVQLRTSALVQETDTVKSDTAERWAEVQQEAASADLRASEALQEAQESVSASAAAAETSTQGLLQGLRAEHGRAWAPDPAWRQALTGVQSADRDADFAKAYTARPLPFGSSEWPFDGHGTYGKQPAPATARGFREETSLTLHGKAKLPLVSTGNRP